MIQFIKDRLNETSTFLLVITGAATANALGWPWNAVAFGAHAVAAFLPDKKVVDDLLSKLK